MKNWFKNHLIPHEGNNHKPHLLRNNNIRNIVFVVLFIEIFTFLIPTLTKINMTGGLASVLPSILSDLTNTERQVQKLNTLTVNPILNKAAEMKAEDMATLGYFAHTSPEGKTPWYWLAQVGYKYQYAGENLAIDFSDSKDVTDAWMNSPTHKANIVKDKYTEVGTGIAKGVYEGKETIFVAQVYANPLIENVNKKNLIDTPIIKTEAIKSTVIKDDSKNILGVETTTEKEVLPLETTNQKGNFVDRLIASPHNTSNIILYIIFILISSVLVLYVFIKVRNHHYGIITNGLIVLVLIFAIMIGNYFISNSNMTIIQSIDYSIENK